MKEQIHELRVKLDGLSQLVKELEFFRSTLIYKQIEEKDVDINLSEDICNIQRVYINHSFFPNYRHQFLLRTDQGTFRWGTQQRYRSNEQELRNIGIDLNSKEINKCFVSLILAKCWLGKILGELGEETPYKNDGNRKTIDDIEKPADKPFVTPSGQFHILEGFVLDSKWTEKNYIEKIDWLRETIKSAVLNKILELDLKGNRELAIARTNSYNHLCEARFYLGLEMQRLKENK